MKQDSTFLCLCAYPDQPWTKSMVDSSIGLPDALHLKIWPRSPKPGWISTYLDSASLPLAQSPRRYQWAYFAKRPLFCKKINEVEAPINKEQVFLRTFTPFTVCNYVYHFNEFTSFNRCWCAVSSSNPKKMLLICLVSDLSQTEGEFPEDGRADSWLQTLAVLLLPELQASDSSVAPGLESQCRSRLCQTASGILTSANTQDIYCACNESPRTENVCRARLYRGFVKINIPIED